ncbi:MAG TPA: leishmanolysin-related zinc metalloendopeptidase [Gemmatimonadales bacterium]
MQSALRRTLAWYSGGLFILAAFTYGCGGGGGATEPGGPAEINLSPASLTFTALGQSQQVSSTVVDGQGNALPDVGVTWTTGDAAVATVTTDGLATAQGVGTTQLTATAGSITARVSVQVTQTPARIEKVAGDGQFGTPGQPVATLPAVRVEDTNGNPISNVVVTFEVFSGGGSVTGASATTNSDGVAEVGSWVLGTSDPNVLRATVAGSGISGNPAEFTAHTTSAFTIEVQFIGNATASQRQAFAEAKARWESLVTGDLPDVQLTAKAGDCGTDSPAINNRRVDDVLVLATVEAIDGPGGVLGSAGPCFIRIPGNQPVMGAMRFDKADLEDIEASGLLSSVILHEMGHVLGFGTLWDAFLVDPSLDLNGGVIAGADPHFTGSAAVTAFDQIGGAAYSGGKVPVEDEGGVGTADSHWRESVFGNELMTGFVSDGLNPLSRVTVASLGDLGFEVNEAGADQFTLPFASLRIAGDSRRVNLSNDLLRVPIKTVTTSGQVMGVFRR